MHSATWDVRLCPVLGAHSMYPAARRVATASGTFFSLKETIFCNDDFHIGAKRVVYGVTILAILLYGSQNWTLRQRDVRKLKAFHLHSIRSMLKVDRGRQITDRISSLQVRR
eukprot:scpid84376/ scgid12902/ 